jgi:hypothetical protein
MHHKWKLLFTLSVIAVASSVMTGAAFAAERGTGFYLLGSKGPSSGITERGNGGCPPSKNSVPLDGRPSRENQKKQR